MFFHCSASKNEILKAYLLRISPSNTGLTFGVQFTFYNILSKTMLLKKCSQRHHGHDFFLLLLFKHNQRILPAVISKLLETSLS